MSIPHLGYHDQMVELPNGTYRLSFIYTTEPPHGDGLYKVIFGNIKFPGLFWGRGLFWSSDSKYITLESYLDGRSRLWVINLEKITYLEIADNFSCREFSYPKLKIRKYGDTSECRDYDIGKTKNWLPLG